MRLSNVKTRTETGFIHVLHHLNVLTPFGKTQLKEIEPFFPGQEHLLEEAFEKVELLFNLIQEKPKKTDLFLEVLMDMKDVRLTLERSKSHTLSMVELFEIKSILLKMRRLTEIMEGELLSPEFFLLDSNEILDRLDPRKDRLDTFYLYDEFSSALGENRKQKRELELQIRKIQKEMKRAVEGKYGISMTPKFDYVVSKANKALLEKAQEIPELVLSDQDYMSTTFTLKGSPEIDEVKREMDHLNEKIEEEELRVREQLSKDVAAYAETLSINCEKIGSLDFILAKALYAQRHACVRPKIIQEHKIEIEGGRHLVVEEMLVTKGKSYCPVSLSLEDGVTSITGANMGGKSVSLKLTGLVAILAQYGLFVPCQTASVGLSAYVHLLIGDSQSIERGLSSFGGEMEELKEILDNSKDRSLLLIDEIASGTNPVEGLALTRSLVEYLKKKPYISLITTHFDRVGTEEGVKNMQVVGLAHADFHLLERELRYANRKERINIIGKYMDYQLRPAENHAEIPKDALNIAKILGVYEEIIDRAKALLEHHH